MRHGRTRGNARGRHLAAPLAVGWLAPTAVFRCEHTDRAVASYGCAVKFGPDQAASLLYDWI
jgi:hypothetical protein